MHDFFTKQVLCFPTRSCLINQHGCLSPVMMYVPLAHAACVPHWTCHAAASAELQLFAHWHLPQQHGCSATRSRGHLCWHTAEDYRSPSMTEKLKRILMSGSVGYKFCINNSGLSQVTSSSAWEGAVKLTCINPIFKEGICRDHLTLSISSGSAAVKPKIRLSDWASLWSRWQNFWCKPPLRRKKVTIINQQQLTNS